MKFEDVMKDIKKLEGLKLQSIRPGAEIVINEVTDDSVMLTTNTGVHKSRSMAEMMRVWRALSEQPAIHVDQVLNGSGSSRNQPETIFANLPYVEWLILDNKKHLTLVLETTHPYGTLKEMDPDRIYKIVNAVRSKEKEQKLKAIIVTDDIRTSLEIIQGVCSGNVMALSQNSYVLETSYGIIKVVSSASTDVKKGTYAILNENRVSGDVGSIISIDNTEYRLIEDEDVIGLLIPVY